MPRRASPAPRTAKQTITVAAAGGGTTTPPSGGGGGGGGGGGTTTPPSGGGGTTTPPAGGGTTTPPAGGDEDAPEAPSLELDAPRSAKARAKSIPVELTASDAGRVQLQLTRGSRVLARAGVRLDADGTADYRLKLPKGTKAGRYTLKATYQSATATRNLTLTGKPAARASAVSTPASEVGVGPRALPDGHFHGARPERTFKVR
jgi:hypothetical protein